MTDINKKIKYHILELIKEFEVNGDLPYPVSMRSVLKGITNGAVSGKYIDSKSFGVFPYLSHENLREVTSEMLEETSIIAVENVRKRKSYFKIADVDYADLRNNFDKIFGLEPGVYKSYSDIINNFAPVRDLDESEASSKSGFTDLELLYGNKKVGYESGLELDFINDLANSGYIKDIIEQPYKLNYGKNNKKKYTIDYLIQTYHNHLILVEVKDLKDLSIKNVLYKYFKLKEIMEKHDIKTHLLTRFEDEWITYEDLLKTDVNEKLEDFMLNRLIEKRSFDISDKKEARLHIDFNELDFQQTIIKNNLKRTGKFDNFVIHFNGILDNHE